MIKTRYFMAIAALLYLPADTLLAQNSPPTQQSGWETKVEIGMEIESTYTGSDEYTTEPDLEFRTTYTGNNGNQYYLSLGEIGVSFPIRKDLSLITALEYEPGRENDEDPILAGFPEQRNTVEGQFTLAKQLGNWTLAGVFQPDILDRGKGVVYFLALQYQQSFSDKLNIHYTADISFSDAEHAATEVGITRAAAATSGLAPYDPSSGYKSTSLLAEFEYQFKSNWTLLLEAGVEFYGRNFSDSPLIQQEGNDVNFEIGAGLRFTF